VPRTEKPNKSAIRVCGDCGYELAPEYAGTCPMCPQFEQLRTEFIVPRPSALAALRARVREMSPFAEEWPPTVAEYRAILVKRSGRPESGAGSPGSVIQPRVLRVLRTTPPTGRAKSAEAELLTPPVLPSPPAQGHPSPPPKRATRRKRGKERRRAARARARSILAAEENGHAVPRDSAAAPASVDARATEELAPPPIGLEAQSDAARASQRLPRPREVARPFPQAVPVRAALQSRTAATWPSPISVAILVAVSALIGAAVSFLLLSLLHW
jgi:hypothetical protein